MNRRIFYALPIVSPLGYYRGQGWLCIWPDSIWNQARETGLDPSGRTPPEKNRAGGLWPTDSCPRRSTGEANPNIVVPVVGVVPVATRTTRVLLIVVPGPATKHPYLRPVPSGI